MVVRTNTESKSRVTSAALFCGHVDVSWLWFSRWYSMVTFVFLYLIKGGELFYAMG